MSLFFLSYIISWIAILIVLIWALVLIFLNKHKPRQDEDYEIKDAPKEFWDSLNTIYTCPDLSALHQVFYNEVKKWPKYKSKLYEVYLERVKILEDAILEHQRIEDQQRELWEFLKKYSYENYEYLKASQQYSWYYDTITIHPQQKKKGLFSECLTEKELKSRFRRLAFLNHPDKGGSPAAMREIIRQYENALLRFRLP